MPADSIRRIPHLQIIQASQDDSNPRHESLAPILRLHALIPTPLGRGKPRQAFRPVRCSALHGSFLH
jgi:hypothetical protein